MVYCQGCGEENPNTAAYCWKCGSKLHIKPKEDVVEPEPQPEESQDTAQTETAEAQPRKARNANVYRSPMILCGFIMTVVLCLALYVVEFDFTMYPSQGIIPIGTESMTLFEMMNEGWNSTISVLVVLTLIFALMSLYNMVFGAFGVGTYMICLGSVKHISEIETGLISVDAYLMSTPDEAMVFAAVMLVLMIVFCILFALFSKALGRKMGTLDFIKALWKSV